MAFNQMIVVPEVCIGNSSADTIKLSGTSGVLDILVVFSGGDKVIFSTLRDKQLSDKKLRKMVHLLKHRYMKIAKNRNNQKQEKHSGKKMERKSLQGRQT